MTADAAPAVDLTTCDREPIHVPGAIQPHGVLITFSEPAFTIAQVSANISAHLAMTPDAVLSRPLTDVVGPAFERQLRAALAREHLDEVNPLEVTIAGTRFDAIVHRHCGATILELEPASAEWSDTVRHPLRAALMGVQAATTVAELQQSVASEVQRLTGFERVMVYRFDEDGHGSVDAELRQPQLEPYLGLRYPASDIPQQARQLYLKNWLRIIPDARYLPSPIVPPARPDTGAPLDLSFAALRSVSPIHLEYLANMGVRASMSISLVVRERLWGLISCVNHSGPRHVPFELRSACEVIGRLTSLQIAALEERESASERLVRRAVVDFLAAAMRAGDDVLDGLLAQPTEVLALVHAHGVAVVHEDDVAARGATPAPELIRQLAEWLDGRASDQTFSTPCLAANYPPAIEWKDVASGVASITLPGVRRRRLVWFRPEVVETVNWGGDPHKPVAVDPGMRIHPRRSFELWKEEVRLRSARWTASDLEAIEELRRRAVEIDLERQVVREQHAVRARDDLVAVVSHDLRNPVGVIQMQSALLARTLGESDEEPSRRARAGMERIQRAAERMNVLIHDLLDLAKIEAGRFAVQRRREDARDVVEEALLLIRPLAEAKRIALSQEVGANAEIHADRERLFQVLSNVVGNAIKFTPEGGAVAVSIEPHEGSVMFSVTDTGPGIPAEQLPHVFNRYWRARRSGREGSGLGLYIAKGIIEAHGGQIWVELPAGGGTRFRFTVPAEAR